jgi:hypothetical protein
VVVNSRIGRGCKQSDWAWWYGVGLGVVVWSRIGRGDKQSDWAWWHTVGLDVVVNSRVGVVVNSRIRRRAKQSD